MPLKAGCRCSEPIAEVISLGCPLAGHTMIVVIHQYYEKPDYKIMTNFPPFVQNPLQHPWMGMDRYQKAEELLGKATDSFDVKDCFNVLKEVSQTVCPTVISMVFDVTERTVYWCYDRNYDQIETKRFLNQ